MKKIKHLYRYVDYFYSGFDTRPIKFRILKETKCGYWITELSEYEDYEDNKVYKLFPTITYSKKWISKTVNKRFAHSTEKEALVAFIGRKHRQLNLLKERIESTQRALYDAKMYLTRNNKEMRDKSCLSKNLRILEV